MKWDAEKGILIDEIDSQLEELGNTPGTCPAHGCLARSIKTLLRCERNHLKQRMSVAVNSGIYGSIAAGVIMGLKEILTK